MPDRHMRIDVSSSSSSSEVKRAQFERFIDLFESGLERLERLEERRIGRGKRTSRSQLTMLTQLALENACYFKHTVHMVERFIEQAACEYKITGLYLMDSIMRHSRYRFIDDEDRGRPTTPSSGRSAPSNIKKQPYLFIDRFERNMSSTLEHIKSCGKNGLELQLRKMIELWRRHCILNNEQADKLLMEVAPEPANPSQMSLNDRIDWMLSTDVFSIHNRPVERLSDFKLPARPIKPTRPASPPTPPPPPPRVINPVEDEHWPSSSSPAQQLKPLVPIKNSCLSVCSRTVWVGHLPKNIDEHFLTQCLRNAAGPIQKINLIPPRGCAYVCFEKREDGKNFLNSRKPFIVKGTMSRLAWASNVGVKDRRRNQFDKEHGCTYVPWNELDHCSGDQILQLADGGIIDEASVSSPIAFKIRKAREGEEEKKLYHEQQNNRYHPPPPQPPVVAFNNNGRPNAWNHAPVGDVTVPLPSAYSPFLDNPNRFNSNNYAQPSAHLYANGSALPNAPLLPPPPAPLILNLHQHMQPNIPIDNDYHYKLEQCEFYEPNNYRKRRNSRPYHRPNNNS